ncbi:TetR/AcrR family transcriptional regulator [Rhodovulum sp. DZ06]|uniref:TetR/AcrR family transcriptional regulator n=1 Tax=Rhodovulum sp. DZ06 TaxID=3425126 RepID=UPI003D34992C
MPEQQAGKGARGSWKQDPEAVQADILRAATELFAERGLSGARIEEIAARTRTSKRMIYYYFGDKDRLWARVLETAYARVRAGEAELRLEGLDPEAALARLVEFTFDHHRRNPDFIRLVMIENVHHAEHLSRSELIGDLNAEAIERLRGILARGESAGVFRPGLDPEALHWTISALSFFNVSNRPTFSALFGDRLFTEDGQAALRAQAVETVAAIARKTP